MSMCMIQFDELCQGVRQRRLRNTWKYKNCIVVKKFYLPTNCPRKAQVAPILQGYINILL